MINDVSKLLAERHSQEGALWCLDPGPCNSSEGHRVLSDEAAGPARREKCALRPAGPWRSGYWQQESDLWSEVKELDELWYLIDGIRLGEVIELGVPLHDNNKVDTKIGVYSLALSPGQVGGCYVSIPSGNDVVWDATVGYYLNVSGALGYEAERCYALGTLDWGTASVDWFRYTTRDDAAWLLAKHRATVESGEGISLRREITMSGEEMIANAVCSSFSRHRSTDLLHRVCDDNDCLRDFIALRGFEFSVKHGLLELEKNTSLTAVTNLIVLGHDCVDAVSDFKRGDPSSMVEMLSGSYSSRQSALFDCFTYYLSQCVSALQGDAATIDAGRVLLANLGWHLASPRYSKRGLVAALTHMQSPPPPGRVYQVMDSIVPIHARLPLTECLQTLRDTVASDDGRFAREAADRIVADTISERIGLGRAFWRACDTMMAEQGNPSELWRIAGQCVLFYLERCASAGATW
jgi:hypothetical protein